jgi:hypothetical protein
MKKTLSIFVTLNILLIPFFVSAATTQPTGVDAYTDYLQSRTSSSQAGASMNGSSQTTGGAGSATKGAAKSGAQCFVGSMLASSLKQMLTGTVTSMTSQQVPTNPVSLTIKETGSTATGGVSMDSIGFCLVNTIITYIGQATVQWIKSGFKGNPVFIDDPAKFFTDVADIEAGNFLGDLTGGYLCGPLRAPVRLRLANDYNQRNAAFNRRAKCTFSGTSANLERFISGDGFSWQDWMSYTQNPYNNKYGATVYGQLELDNRIAGALGVQSKLADWGKGFLSFTDPETKKVYTPGSMIEDQLNKQLDNPRQRLLIADEFDEVVTALVNELIKVALNELTNKSSGSSDTGSNYYDGNLNDNNAQTVSTFIQIQSSSTDSLTPDVNWGVIKTSYSANSVCSAELNATAPAPDCFFSYSSQSSDQQMVRVVSQMKNFAKNQGNVEFGITAQGLVTGIVVEFADGSKDYTYLEGFSGINIITDDVLHLLTVADPQGARDLTKIYLFQTADLPTNEYTCGFSATPKKIIKLPDVLSIAQSAIFEAKLTKVMNKLVNVETYVVTKSGEVYEYDLPVFSGLYSDLQNLASGSQIDQVELRDVLETDGVDTAVCVSSATTQATNQNLLKYIKSINDIGAYIVETTKFN